MVETKMRGKILVSAMIVLFIVSTIPVLADESTSVDLTVTILRSPNKKPKADAGPNVKTSVGTIIQFSGAGSYDKDGEIVSYSWSFGDEAMATGLEVSHSYSESGHYTVTLTVKDDMGAEDSDKCQIRVWDRTWPIMNRFGELVQAREVKVDVEDLQGVSGARTDDVEYWALVIGISDYEGTGSDLTYCDDDALDIRSALVNYHGWNPDNIFLLLDSNATGPNVVNRFNTLLTLVDANDVFLFTFSGHGTVAEDGKYGDPKDELDRWDELLVLYDLVTCIWDDDLEYILGLFATDKIMVFLDSCYSGGFIKATSEFGEENLVCRSLPSSEPVEIIDSFARDLDDTGFVVLTACDDDGYSYEHPALENGVFTYFFVEGIESGFLADLNTNSRISAEEAFDYASQPTTDYVDNLIGNYYQYPHLYDGVSGELEFTVPYISINIDPSDIGFGTVNTGESGTDTITVMNTGNTAAKITATLSDELPDPFYTTNLKLDGLIVSVWSIPSLAPDDPTPVDLTLGIPLGTEAGSKTANLIFWAEIPP